LSAVGWTLLLHFLLAFGVATCLSLLYTPSPVLLYSFSSRAMFLYSAWTYTFAVYYHLMQRLHLWILVEKVKRLCWTTAMPAICQAVCGTRFGSHCTMPSPLCLLCAGYVPTLCLLTSDRENKWTTTITLYSRTLDGKDLLPSVVFFVPMLLQVLMLFLAVYLSFVQPVGQHTYMPFFFCYYVYILCTAYMPSVSLLYAAASFLL
jgi:hypothetical protein